jgi:glycosyltransferase involved in cell wall biosynthesis
MPPVSIILPVFRKAESLPRFLAVLGEVIGTLPQRAEIIAVDDGSGDGTPDALLRHQLPGMRVVALPSNVGKGEALRSGFAVSTGDPVVFLDADLDLHPRQIVRLLALRQALDADVAVGSKRHPMSRVHYPPLRRLLSFGFQTIVWAFFGLNVRDTQVGLKVFRRRVLETVLPLLVVKRFAFDLELLVAAKRQGFRIAEGPVDLEHQFTSTIVPTRTVRQMLWETAAIYYRMRFLRQYNKTRRGPSRS